jgi:hypothetical protein
MGLDTFYVMSAHHALVSCCYYSVDAILSKMYSWLNDEGENIPMKYLDDKDSDYESNPATDYDDDDNEWEDWESDDNSIHHDRDRNDRNERVKEDNEYDHDDNDDIKPSDLNSKDGIPTDISNSDEKRSRTGRRKSSTFSRASTVRTDRTADTARNLDLHHLSHILRSAMHSLMHKSIAKIVDPSGYVTIRTYTLNYLFVFLLFFLFFLFFLFILMGKRIL